MPRLWLKDYLVIKGGILLIAVVTLALVASPAAAQTTANGPYYATPSWDQQLPAAQRFIVLTNWGSAAVLDRETGLVWQRTPSNADADWPQAMNTCRIEKTGGRAGWRLPSIEELQSLIDPAQSNLALPPGHPFTNVGSGYWSATTATFLGFAAYTLFFETGGVGVAATNSVDVTHLVWCVRGGSGVQAPQPLLQ